jgi:uncharacterized protein YkwD
VTSRIRNKMAAALLGIALATGAAPATSLFTGTAEATTAPSMTKFDVKLIQLINTARINRGLRPLQFAAGTSDVAHTWSCHMANHRLLSHNGSLGSDLETHGSRLWTSYDENVGYVARTAGAKRLFRAYMNSPEHRANILDSSVRYIGSWSKVGGHKRYNTIDFVGNTTTAYSTAYGAMRTTC